MRAAASSTCRCGIRPSISATANPRLNAALKRQLDTLPQVASQYLHREKIELAALIAQDAEAKFGARAACTSMSAAPRRSRIR
jgi:4-aminobutyrate aminotransferase-like enzyme